MTPEKTRLTVAVCAGLLVGFLVRPVFLSERFAIHVVKETGPIKIDKRTGATWQYSQSDKIDDMVWKPIRTD